MAKYQIKLEPLCEVEAYVTEPIPVGPSSWGTRLIFPVVGEGTVKGPKLKGKIRSFGGDWGVVRADNCFDLDVRIFIETADGALIHTYYRGIVAMTKEQVNQFLAGELPNGLSLYTTPRFEMSHEKYQWLTQIQAVGRGGVEQEGDYLFLVCTNGIAQPKRKRGSSENPKPNAVRMGIHFRVGSPQSDEQFAKA